MTADIDQPALVVPPPSSRRRWGWWVAIGVTVFALVAAGTAVHSWWHNRSPFGPAAVHPQLVGLQVMTPSDDSAANVVAAMRALGDSRQAADVPLPASLHWQYVVGRVDVGAHSAPAGTELDLIVIDNRTQQLPRLIFGLPKDGSDSGGEGAGSSYSSADNSLGAKYPWLSALHEHGHDGGFTDPGMVVSFPPGPARSLPFVAVLPTDALPVTNRHSDLTIALALLGPDGQPYWAKQLN